MFQITKRSSSQCSVLETDYSSHVTRAREHRLSLLVTPSKGHFFLVGRFVGAGPLHSEFDRKVKNKRYLRVGLLSERGVGGCYFRNSTVLLRL